MSLNGSPRIASMRSQIQVASSHSSVNSRASMSPRCHAGDQLAPSPSKADRPSGMRSAIERPTRRPLAGAEVLSEGDLPDAVVAVLKCDDVRDLAPTPLVDRLVVVADDTQVGAELREAADQPLLERIDVLVLVDHDEADVVADVSPDEPRSHRRRRSPSSNCDGEVDHLSEVEVRVSVQKLHVVPEETKNAVREPGLVDRVLSQHVVACMYSLECRNRRSLGVPRKSSGTR